MIIKTHEWKFQTSVTMYHGKNGDQVYYHGHHYFCVHCGTRKLIREFVSGTRMFSYHLHAGEPHSDKNTECSHREPVDEWDPYEDTSIRL